MTTEYAKRSPEEVLGLISVTNRASEEATVHILPTVWYRNTWVWGCEHEGCTMKPLIKKVGAGVVHCKHDTLPKSRFYWGPDQDGKQPNLLFTENETNTKVCKWQFPDEFFTLFHCSSPSFIFSKSWFRLLVWTSNHNMILRVIWGLFISIDYNDLKENHLGDNKKGGVITD